MRRRGNDGCGHEAMRGARQGRGDPAEAAAVPPCSHRRMAGTPLPAHQGTAAAASSTSTTAASSSGSAECGTPSVLRSSTAAKIKGQGGRAGGVL